MTYTTWGRREEDGPSKPSRGHKGPFRTFYPSTKRIIRQYCTMSALEAEIDACGLCFAYIQFIQLPIRGRSVRTYCILCILQQEEVQISYVMHIVCLHLLWFDGQRECWTGPVRA